MRRHHSIFRFVAAGMLCVVALGCGEDPNEPAPPTKAWSAVGPGFSLAVQSLTILDGDLVAAGAFTQSGNDPVRHIARRAGGAWVPMGPGLTPSGAASSVRALTVFRGELIAGGDFTQAGDSSASRIACWDGSAWHPLGSGVDGEVRALIVHDGALVAGGAFTRAGDADASHVARWDGASWHPLGAGMNAEVDAFAIHSGRLIAGGLFTRAGEIDASYLAQWDGSRWVPLATGTDGQVLSLGLYKGALVAGGRFSEAGGDTARCIAAWDGDAWHPLGKGIGLAPEAFPFAGVAALAESDGDLIAGGFFMQAGGAWASNIARWDGSAWHAMGGTDNAVLALTVLDGGLFAGGGFTWAGGITALRIARWGF